jgi:hypothetical protein
VLAHNEFCERYEFWTKHGRSQTCLGPRKLRREAMAWLRTSAIVRMDRATRSALLDALLEDDAGLRRRTGYLLRRLLEDIESYAFDIANGQAPR